MSEEDETDELDRNPIRSDDSRTSYKEEEMLSARRIRKLSGNEGVTSRRLCSESVTCQNPGKFRPILCSLDQKLDLLV